jgi:hypothetical protein
MAKDIQKFTDVGFKISINRTNPVENGRERAFVKCKKCNCKAFYDYVPYSLSNPMMLSNCGHRYYEYYKPF